VTTHLVLQYFTNKYMNGISSDEFVAPHDSMITAIPGPLEVRRRDLL